MTFVWLIIWAISGTPHVGHWNTWMVALVVCAGIDLYGSKSRMS